MLGLNTTKGDLLTIFQKGAFLCETVAPYIQIPKIDYVMGDFWIASKDRCRLFDWL